MSLIVERQDTATPHEGGQPLKIGMIAPPWFELPPAGYGGTETVVAGLVDQLVDRGHEVTLVGSGRSGTRAQDFRPVYDTPPSHLLGSSVMPELVLAAEVGRIMDELDVDIVHDHSAAGPLLARHRRQPTVVTMHGPVAGENGDYHRRLGSTVGIIAISDAQRRQAPELNWVGTVHNAIDVAAFPFREQKSDTVLWLGRFSPDKGAHVAIETARRAGRKIILAGKLTEPSEKAYFDREVRPLLSHDAEYIGEADTHLKRELFANAACLLFPIQWEEPFGMVMAEALACGTPVIATRRGSVPEIVRHGENGFIADAADQLVEVVQRASEIDPHMCRNDAEQRFDLPVMAAGYERIYRMLAEGTAEIRTMTGTADASEPRRRSDRT